MIDLDTLGTHNCKFMFTLIMKIIMIIISYST